MSITVIPSKPTGSLAAPPSKSYMQRLLVAALLAPGPSEIINPGNSRDERQMSEVIKKLGATISFSSDRWEITGGLKASADTIEFGESGLGIRLITPVAAMLDREITITGTGSLRKRPMGIFEKALLESGGYCQTNNGLLPIKIKGPLTGGEIRLHDPISSQFLSGLLFALPAAQNDSLIQVSNLKSIPYVDMTLEVLDLFGIAIHNSGYHTFKVPGRQVFRPTKTKVEGDWSNAAFFFVMGAVHGNMAIHGLNPESLQADKRILDAVKNSGAQWQHHAGAYRFDSPGKLQAFQFDATDCPDLFPPLAVLASYCKGTSAIRGVHRLEHKESNREQAIIKELSAQGIRVVPGKNDDLLITGSQPRGGPFDSHNDHRMAMAGATLATGAREPIEITGAGAVAKSYPGFFKDLEKLHLNLSYGIGEKQK